MDWWILELIRFFVLIGGAVLVQRLIRRAGKVYVDEMFHESPRAGRAFIALADIAFYLIVVAYTLFSLDLAGHSREVEARQVQDVAYAVAGLALIIGLLHGFNILMIPAMGRALAQRAHGKEPTRARPEPRSTAPGP